MPGLREEEELPLLPLGEGINRVAPHKRTEAGVGGLEPSAAHLLGLRQRRGANLHTDNTQEGFR